MKRSSKLALVSAAGVAAVLAYTWSGTDAEPETESDIYTSVSDCVSFGKDEATCKARFGEALEAYNNTAPRFVNLQDCEKDFGAGACTSASVPEPTQVVSNDTDTAQSANAAATSGGTSYFMPMMMGFMAGRMMQNASMGPQAAPLYGCAQGSPSGAGASCYSSNSGRSYYAYTSSAGSRTVKTPVSEFRSAPKRSFNVIPRGGSAVKAAVSSRGGFGGTSRGYSSGGFGG